MPSFLSTLLSRLISALRCLKKSSDTPDTPSSPSAPPPASFDNVAWIGLEAFRKAAGLSATKAQDWYPHVRAACLEFNITAPVRLAAFLAQVGHESAGFQYTREIWGPTRAQKRYEGREDLGNTKPGDGSRFRGRGLIQITGRANYQKASVALGIDAVANPQLLEEPAMAARSAGWWWAAHGCNELADSGGFVALTRRINGGTNGLDDRIERWERAKAVLGA